MPEENTNGVAPHTAAATPLDPGFVDLLACPACGDRPPLRLTEEGDALACGRCGRTYPISPEGIPILVVDEAETTGP